MLKPRPVPPWGVCVLGVCGGWGLALDACGVDVVGGFVVVGGEGFCSVGVVGVFVV